MVEIIIKPGNKCKITGDIPSNVIRILDQELSFDVPGAQYTYQYKFQGWDGKKRLMSSRLEFGYGLLSRVKTILTNYKVDFSVIDKRIKTIAKPYDIQDNLKKINKLPRDYQLDAANKVFEKDIGIIKVATGGGKCIDVDSMNFTEFGILNFKEICEKFNLEINNPQNYKDLSLNLITPIKEEGKDKSSHVYYDGYGESFYIKSQYGYDITATPKHKLKVLSENGEIIWKTAKDISIGDYLVISPGAMTFGNRDDISEDDAYWYGLLAGDGSLTTKGKISLTNCDDYILNFTTDYLNKNNIKYNIRPNYRRINNERILGKSKTINIHSSLYKKKLQSLGFESKKSTEKIIPVSIRESNQKIIGMFLRGIYETDGWIQEGKVSIGLSNKTLIKQIQMLLLNFGILSSIRVKKTNRLDSYILTIYSDGFELFDKFIGFCPGGRKYNHFQNQISIIKSKNKNSNTDLIFNQSKNLKDLMNFLLLEFNKKDIILNNTKIKTLASWISQKRIPSRKKLKSFIDDIMHIVSGKSGENITSIQNILEKLNYVCKDCFYYLPVVEKNKILSHNWDFCIPETHSFVSQGFINHNTLISAVAIANLGKPANLYVTGKDLLYQFHELYQEVFNEPIGIIGDGHCDIKRINIVSVWSVSEAFGEKAKSDEIDIDELLLGIDKKEDIAKCLSNAKVHIFDECHGASCETIQLINNNIAPDEIYGMSASPWRSDNSEMMLEAMLGHPIVDISASYLIDKKFLVQPIIKFINVPKYHGKLKKNYQSIVKDYVVENEVRNNIIVEQTERLVKLGYKVLVLFNTIKHGDILYKLISKNTKCSLISGKDNIEVRDKAKNDLNDGNIDVIISSRIFDTGVDIPKLSGLVIAGPAGRARTTCYQRVGRVIRIFNNKKTAAIIDFMDNAPFLKDHSEVRLKTYKEEDGFIVKV
jgi:superfamily II DNA or RNA helicase